MHMYLHTETEEQAPIMHSLKSCNSAATAFSGGTQKNQCRETNTPGLSNEGSLGGKTEPAQSSLKCTVWMAALISVVTIH